MCQQAHPEVLDVLVELVMAMGWTRASLIAQDVANALIWRLHADTNERLDTYAAGARRQTDVFDRAWARRVALPHDD